MDEVSAGHELSLFSRLYSDVAKMPYVQGLHGCPALHKGLGGRCRGTWCEGPLPWLRAAGRAKGTGQKGWGRQKQPSGRKSYTCLLEESRGHRRRDSRAALANQNPHHARCGPQAGGGAQLCAEAEVDIRIFFFFFPVGKSPTSARIVSKPHPLRHLQG